MNYSVVYITVKDMAEAKKVGESLVREKLVACVNMLDGMQSLYWWEGKVTEDNEAIVIAKTRRSLVSKVISRVRELHSYTVPCVVSWPIADGNSDYIAWIGESTIDT